MATLYRLRVAENHRYESLPVRLKSGGKLRVTKLKSEVIAADKLAEGEAFTLSRYKEEGRMIVEELVEMQRAYLESVLG